MVIPPSVLIQVGLKMFSGNRVVNSVYPTLYERPEALYCVCVDIPTHINLFHMVNLLMLESTLVKVLVSSHFVSVYWIRLDGLETYPPALCYSVGFLMEDTPEYKTIALGISEAQVLGRMTIPSGFILLINNS